MVVHITTPYGIASISLLSSPCWDDSHRRQELGDYLTRKDKKSLPRCPGAKECPLGVKHPPAGTEFVLVCCGTHHVQCNGGREVMRGLASSIMTWQ